MDKEMIERCVAALKDTFKDIVSESANAPFDETNVSVPPDNIWAPYALAVIKSMREPTEAMLLAEIKHSSDPYASWTNMIDSITGVK